MQKRLPFFKSWLLVLSVLTSACQGSGSKALDANAEVIHIVYGSEKVEWLEPLIQEYNAARHKTANDEVILIQGTPMGSIESVNGIITGELQPVIWSPASSIYLPVANAEWRKTHSDDLITGNPKDLVLSPVVIAMWKPMAEALGWPSKSLGWKDIANFSASNEGWEAYGFPEWGNFKFGHTHPNFSNSGIVSIIAEAYSGADKQRDLTIEDLQDESLQSFMADVEKAIIHYGTSTGFFAERMFERGPSYLSAAVLYENLVVAQESKRINGSSSQIPVVAIYPKEGTFWSNHPYVILNAPWVTKEKREAATDFEAFLLDRPQQLHAIDLGFRPADPSIPLTFPLDSDHGVDIQQPKTVLEIPSVDVIIGIQELWRQIKKPVDLVVVLDTSGSMEGEKISAARNSLNQFVSLLDDRDRLEIILFNSEIITLTDLSPLGEKRDGVVKRVSAIIETGNTRLYDSVDFAFKELEAKGDPNHIRAIVVLSDGMDTDSVISFGQMIDSIGATGEEAGSSTKLFTIAFGEDADKDILKTMADSTGGKQYISDPRSINQVYRDIATFF